MERLVRNWRRVESDPEGYLRRTLYNLAADGWRQRGRRRAMLALGAQPRSAQPDPANAISLRDAVARLLAELPPKQRAVLLLRYWEQRSEAETAALLGCSPGTVKSASARGLARLRELTTTWPEAEARQRTASPTARKVKSHDRG